MPVLRGNTFGDLYIRINTQVPTSLTKKQKEILEEFNEIERNKPDPVIKVFERLKSFGEIHNLNEYWSDNDCNFSNCSIDLQFYPVFYLQITS